MLNAKHWTLSIGLLFAVSILFVGCGGNGAPPETTLPSTVEDENDAQNDDTAQDDEDGQGDGPLDSDGDGFSDDEEINGIPGTDPFDPTDNSDNVRDTDGDGCSDFDELNFAGFCDNDPNTPDGGDAPTPSGDVSISGQLTVADSFIIDGDTNDPNNDIIDNNAEDLTKVQPLPNPCTLGGYLGTIGSGVDFTDAYRVQMAADQTASLLLANPDINDFDLYLYDEAGNPLDSSEGVGKAEQVAAPVNGTFIVEVFAYNVVADSNPGGLYTLLIGENALGAASSKPRERLSSIHEFVEGEIIVRYEEGAAGALSVGANDDLELEVLNAAVESGGIERLRVKSTRRMRQRGHRTTVASQTGVLNRPVSDTIATIKMLRRQSGVAYAQPNYIRRAFATPNDEFFPYQWHYTQIGLEEAWDITTGDADVIVAVIDTGVLLAHPDLQGQFVAGYDFISDPQMSRDGDGIDPDPNDPGDLAIQGTTSSFHGTHVAGTVAARSNNGTGVAGVAWDVRIMPVRVLGLGGGTDFDITQGIRYAAGLSNVSGQLPAQRADAINLSLGGPGISNSEQEAIDEARTNGVIVIAAAGNESSNADFSSPAGLDGVVTVSAVGYTSQLAPYSNFGSCIDVTAPGGDLSADANGDTYTDGVLSSMGHDDGSFTYDFSNGTSMAAPHVAGVAALMKSVNPDLSPEDFGLLLAGNHPGTTIAITDDLGQTGRDDDYGYGLISAFAAVQAAADIAGVSTIDAPVIRALPRVLDFGSDLTSSTVTVRNAGVDTLEVTSVTTSDSWLFVTPASGGDGEYTVSVDRGGLADGVYSGSVEFVSNGGTASVSVRMNVGEQGATGGDIGAVYVLLLDLEVFATIEQEIATASNGYTFNFIDVPPGEYAIFAGTDMNNDTYIDDEGEALGGYPTLLDSQVLDAYQDRAGLTFGVSFLINVQKPTSTTAPAAEPTGPPHLRRIKEKRSD